MLKLDLILQNDNQIDHFLKRNKNVTRLMKYELGGQIMTKFVGLR